MKYLHSASHLHLLHFLESFQLLQWSRDQVELASRQLMKLPKRLEPDGCLAQRQVALEKEAHSMLTKLEAARLREELQTVLSLYEWHFGWAKLRVSFLAMSQLVRTQLYATS